MGENATIKVHLEGVEETLLLPLWARAQETRRKDALFRDERAVEMVEQIDYDFRRFDAANLSVAIRTELLDKAVREFLRRHPRGTIVNLGAGLDTRFFRLDNGELTWVEVDLPRSMALRRRLIPESPRHHYVEGSILESDWLAAIAPQPGEPVLVIAEGLFMYFKERQLRDLLARLAARFPGAELLFETMSPQMKVFLQGTRLIGIDADFKWGLLSGRELESWLPGLRWIEDWCYFDQHPNRWGPLAALSYLPFFRSMLRIEHVRLPE